MSIILQAYQCVEPTICGTAFLMNELRCNRDRYKWFAISIITLLLCLFLVFLMAVKKFSLHNRSASLHAAFHRINTT